jgi:hypothetical protein
MGKCFLLAAIGLMQPLHACATADTATAGADAFTAALSSATLLDPAGMQQALQELGLLAVPDILRLDAAESKEMVSSLRGAGVTLGDRSRLRELADSSLRFGVLLDPPSQRPDAQAAPARALQELRTEDSSSSISG